jgi:uncharacterized membrane protein (DUF373 family)
VVSSIALQFRRRRFAGSPRRHGSNEAGEQSQTAKALRLTDHPLCLTTIGAYPSGEQMLSRISKALTGRTLYDQFELIVSGIVLFLVSAVIVFTTILTTIELIQDFLMGMKFLDAEVFKDTFGLILTILILLEFNHSIVSALRRRAGSIQVSIIVLITITVIARKLILLDYASATPETLLGLGGLALALGVLYWLIAGVERRGRSSSEQP